MTSLRRSTARELAAQLRGGQVSAREVVQDALRQIDTRDRQLGAFISVDPDAALEQARRLDALPASARGPLHGVPIAVKDVTDARGFRTSYGSSIPPEAPAARDELSIHRLRGAGAVVVGKTNVPEYGFGAVCTNQLVGPARNPWDPTLTSGGSSGGSAVAVTAGLIPLAQGVDFAGSVRTPASFCGCVGLRPTPGMIPEPNRPDAWANLVTQGVLARNVADADLMLQVMAGPHPMDPTSRRVRQPGRTAPLRAAASCDLGGLFRVDEVVRSEFWKAIDRIGDAFGTVIKQESPPLDGGIEAFKILRAAAMWVNHKDLVTSHADQLGGSIVWNARQGEKLTAEQYLTAQHARSTVYRQFRKMLERYDILLLPAASVLPFPITQEEVYEIGGLRTESIIDYLACTFLVSLVGFPAMSIPGTLTDTGLPIGLQLVARPDEEATLINAGRVLEQIGFRHRWPPEDSQPNPA